MLTRRTASAAVAASTARSAPQTCQFHTSGPANATDDEGAPRTPITPTQQSLLREARMKQYLAQQKYSGEFQPVVQTYQGMSQRAAQPSRQPPQQQIRLPTQLFHRQAGQGQYSGGQQQSQPFRDAQPVMRGPPGQYPAAYQLQLNNRQFPPQQQFGRQPFPPQQQQQQQFGRQTFPPQQQFAPLGQFPPQQQQQFGRQTFPPQRQGPPGSGPLITKYLAPDMQPPQPRQGMSQQQMPMRAPSKPPLPPIQPGGFRIRKFEVSGGPDPRPRPGEPPQSQVSGPLEFQPGRPPQAPIQPGGFRIRKFEARDGPDPRPRPGEPPQSQANGPLESQPGRPSQAPIQPGGFRISKRFIDSAPTENIAGAWGEALSTVQPVTSTPGLRRVRAQQQPQQQPQQQAPISLPDNPPARESGSLSFNASPPATPGLGPRAIRRRGATRAPAANWDKPRLSQSPTTTQPSSRTNLSSSTSSKGLKPLPSLRPVTYNPISPTPESLFPDIPSTLLSPLGQSRILTSALPQFHKPVKTWTDSDWEKYDLKREALKSKVIDGQRYHWDWAGMGGVDGAQNGGKTVDAVRRLVSKNRSYGIKAKRAIMGALWMRLPKPVIGAPAQRRVLQLESGSAAKQDVRA